MISKIEITDDLYRKVKDNFLRLCFNKQDAEDLTQQFFLNWILNGRQQTYRYALIDFLRVSTKRGKLKYTELKPHHFNNLKIPEFEINFDKMSLTQRLICVFILWGYSQKDIADLIDVDASTISLEMIKVKRNG